MSVEISNTVGAPEFLNVKFFNEVLENGLFETGAVVEKISIESGSSAGDNYCSQIFRVRLIYQSSDGSTNNVSVIVKSIPVSEDTRFLEDLRVFIKEKIVYHHLLPRMEVLLDEVKFGPKVYYDQKEPVNTLVFEDLSALDYVMIDRVKGLDLSHTQLVMRKIGQFHGVSMVLHKKDPDFKKSFSGGLLSADAVNASKAYKTMFGTHIQSLIQLISTWEGYESIVSKLKKYASNLIENLIKTQLPIPGELKVLNHGDCWVNNMLFKYTEDKQVQDVVFVDLQMSVFGSPGIDLNYFLYSSVQLDVLKEKREEILRTYHTAMSEVLVSQNYKDIPTFEDILKEVRRGEYYGFFTNFGILPIVCMEKAHSTDNSFETFLDDDIIKKKSEIMYSSKRVQDTLRYTLKRFDEMGILD